MKGDFVFGSELPRERLDWGTRGWFRDADDDGAEALVVVEVDLLPGFGHNFHHHPRQEEVVYVVAGEIEQWIESEKRTLRSGDSALIGPGTVHASFNESERPAKLLAILGPAVGESGYEVVEVGDQHQWASLR